MPTELADACRRIRTLLEQGAPWDACDAFNDTQARHPADPELLYVGALAHARAGATSRAHTLLDAAEAAAEGLPDWLVEVLSLRGRLWKDRLHRARDPAARADFATRARDGYLAAHALRHDTFPGINAATLSLLIGDADTAAALARDIARRLEVPGAELDGWQSATLGEAQLLLGRADAARSSYAAAVDRAGAQAGTVATMRRQVSLLATALPEAAAVLDVLPAGCVLAFAGHMVDTPDRTAAPRFPAQAEAAIAEAIRARLAALPRPVVYTSAACGADLLCIEAALALGAEVNIVLPFDRDDFIATSVAVGGARWVPRFEHALRCATRVIYATEEGYLGDDVLFDHAASLVEGMALLRAGQLDAVPVFLAVLDPDAEGGLGGTRDSVARWRTAPANVQTIDLRPFARAADRSLPATQAALAPPCSPPEPTPTPTPTSRTLKTLLFADFSGFSRLHDAFAPLFHTRFLRLVSQQIDACPSPPLEANTWGDALYVVFATAPEGADFALRLLESIVEVDWTATGLPEHSQIRIALHAGPVFCGFDPIIGRNNFFGSSVTRTARIEPITPPGTIYTSEAFAATLAARGEGTHVTEYMGRLKLAKSHGEMPIYRLQPR